MPGLADYVLATKETEDADLENDTLSKEWEELRARRCQIANAIWRPKQTTHPEQNQESYHAIAGNSECAPATSVSTSSHAIGLQNDKCEVATKSHIGQ